MQEVKNYSKYMIASQTAQPQYGWNYNFLEDINKKIQSEKLGKLIIDYNYSYYDGSPSSYKLMLDFSFIDLSKISNVEKKLSDIFSNDIEFEYTNKKNYSLVDLSYLASRFSNRRKAKRKRSNCKYDSKL